VVHISLSDFASCLLVIPATANVIGQVAHGLCDDVVTCTVCAMRGPVYFAPAMNDAMWDNRVVRDNVRALKKYGYRFVGPVKGKLATGKRGMGRLSPVEDVVAAIEKGAKNG